MEDPRIQAIVGAIRSPRFKEVLNNLGGYDDSITGVLRQVP